MLRIETDIGTVALLDIRTLLHFKNYALAAFPNTRVASNSEDIKQLMRDKEGPEYFVQPARTHIKLFPTWKYVSGLFKQKEESLMPEKTDTTALVEIRSVSVDKGLPQKERCAEFKRQIKNMNNYKYKRFIVKAIYADNGTTIEDCLRGMMA